jgi:hypothetical protein
MGLGLTKEEESRPRERGERGGEHTMRKRNLITELLAAVLVGDGVLSFVSPRRYLLAVEFGPEAYKRALEELAERTPLTRLLALGQVGLGLFIASRGFPQEEE